jgi:GNAT superfamily N-acetyltransferase
MSPEWVIVPLHKQHNRTQFDCGESELNAYLQKFARQNDENYLSKTFVAVSSDQPEEVIGFYSLSAGSIEFDTLPVGLYKRLPRYPIPVVRLTRLAVAKRFQGRGLGQSLLMDALARYVKLSKEIGILGLIVNAKHERAKQFYLKYDFQELAVHSLTLFLPTRSIMAMMGE